jgi:hypothetical protein
MTRENNSSIKALVVVSSPNLSMKIFFEKSPQLVIDPTGN